MNGKGLRMLCLLLALLLSGCGKPAQSPAGVAFVDDLGRETVFSPGDRVAVLSGSLADAWVLSGGTLCAVTEDYFDLPGSAAAPEISVGSLKNPNLEQLVALDIDAAVLSANLSTHVALAPELQRLGIRTAYFEVESFEDYRRLMDIFTDITGRKELYEANAAQTAREIEAQLARADGSAPRVLFLRSFSTDIKAKGSDSMTGRMLQDLGCVNIADREGAFSGGLSMEAILLEDPDFIFVTTMGEDAAAREYLNRTFESSEIWNRLTAVKNGRYHLLDKELFQNKPNARWSESYRILADILYGGDSP